MTMLYSSVLLLSISSILFLYFIPVTNARIQNRVIFYFRLFFIAITLSCLSLTLKDWLNNPLFGGLSGLIYLIGFYTLRQGLMIRSNSQIKELYHNTYFWVHIGIFAFIHCYLLVYVINSTHHRIHFLTLNLLAVLFTTLPHIEKKSAIINKKSSGEKIAKYGFYGIFSTLVISLFVLYNANSLQHYFSIALPLQLLNIHIAILSLLALVMSDGIEKHYDNSIKDPMTGLYNRRFFMKETKRLNIHNNEEKLSAMILCDIDHFKKINDVYGHEAGDKVIIAFAQLLQSCLPTYAVLSRIGGEEFAIFLPHSGRVAAEKLAKKMCLKTENMDIKSEDNQPLKFTASFGVAVFSGEIDIKHYLRCADSALYVAKKNGRNQVVFYDADINDESLSMNERIAS